LEDTYPEVPIVLYDLELSYNVDTFKKIFGIVENILPTPLVGVFKNDDLSAIASVDLSKDGLASQRRKKG